MLDSQDNPKAFIADIIETISAVLQANNKLAKLATIMLSVDCLVYIPATIAPIEPAPNINATARAIGELSSCVKSPELIAFNNELVKVVTPDKFNNRIIPVKNIE